MGVPPTASPESPMIFRPDADVAEHLTQLIYRGQVNVHIKLEMTDLRSGHIQSVFVRWTGGELDLETLIYHIQAALGAEPMLDHYESFFWLFWRGWVGELNPVVLEGLPAVTPDLLEKLSRGVPLRDSDLRRLGAALEWAFADIAGEWGTTESWQEGTISPGHLKLRQRLRTFIEERMVALHGPGFENAPVR